jgi:CubicO group peptidase (beta-lactamase class C family)
MKSIGQQITDLAREKDFSGVISIFEGNAAIYNESFGFRDVANELPNEKDTKFGIASGTKLFTALGIGKLIEQGRISLGSRIRNIGSEYHTFISENATISHLLSHTSGIFDYYDEEIFNDSDDFFVAIPWYHLETPSDYLPLFKDQKAKF